MVLTALAIKKCGLLCCNAVWFGEGPTFARNILSSSSGSKNEPSNKLAVELSLPPASAGLLLGLLFGPEDGGDMYLRNILLSSNYMALRPRRRRF
jgi:hypothetical protein